jgi:hypothetical protein
LKKWVDAIQAFALIGLVILTGYYAWQTHSLADATKQMAEEIQRQTELGMGTNRPHVEIDLTQVAYSTFPSLPLGESRWLTRIPSIPSAIKVCVTNKGKRDALGLQAYVIGKSYDTLITPQIPGMPSTPRYWYWSTQTFKQGYLREGETEEIRFEYSPKFEFIQEPEKIYAPYVPFELAVVVICQDDFTRVWLSSLELKLKRDLEQDRYQLEKGEMRVFEVRSKT